MLIASYLGAAQGTLMGLGQEGSFKSDFLHGLEKPAWFLRQTLNLRTINGNSSSSSQWYLQRWVTVFLVLPGTRWGFHQSVTTQN